MEENPDINTDSIKAICQQMDKNSLISECQCLNALGQIERMNEKRGGDIFEASDPLVAINANVLP